MRHIPAFQIFYSTTFTVLFTVLVALLLVTPGDAIRQAIINRQIYNIIVIAGVYFVTLLLAILIYASRLFTNRSVLASIPKPWIPIERDDVGHKVRKMIVEGLTRSATIAADATPRDLRAEGAGQVDGTQEEKPKPTAAAKEKKHHSKGKQKATAAISEKAPSSPPPPPWGDIAHPGWSSPSTPDFPNLQYRTVILELPNLIEAKAVSLAPADPSLPPTNPPTPSPAALALLQRPATTGLRAYITHLTSLSLIDPPSLAAPFLNQYERARFDPRPITEPDFRALMRAFAEILRGMTALPDALLARLHLHLAPTTSADTDDASFASFSTTDDPLPNSAPTPRSSSSRSSTSSRSSRSSRTRSDVTVRSAPPTYLSPPPPAIGDTTSPSTPGWQTAPATPATGIHHHHQHPQHPREASRQGYFSSPQLPLHAADDDNVAASGLLATDGDVDGARVRVPYGRARGSEASATGSVIRLTRPDEGTGLPYAIEV